MLAIRDQVAPPTTNYQTPRSGLRPRLRAQYRAADEASRSRCRIRSVSAAPTVRWSSAASAAADPRGAPGAKATRRWRRWKSRRAADPAASGRRRQPAASGLQRPAGLSGAARQRGPRPAGPLLDPGGLSAGGTVAGRRTAGCMPAGCRCRAASGFLGALEALWRGQRDAGDAGDVWATPAAPAAQADAGAALGPFRGGWVVFLGYELAARSSRGWTARRAGDATPERRRRSRCASRRAGLRPSRAGRPGCSPKPGGTRCSTPWAQRWPGCRQPPRPDRCLRPGRVRRGARSRRKRPSLSRARRGALEYIRAGDIYQANLSRALARRACRARQRAEHGHAARSTSGCAAPNPAPFAALAQFQDWRLLSSSPERLVRVHGRRVETRPIAGTRPRSGAAAEHGARSRR